MDKLWIGGRSPSQPATPRSFTWAQTRERLHFTSWESGEPNGSGDLDSCVIMNKMLTWNDVPCNSKVYGTYCEFLNKTDTPKCSLTLKKKDGNVSCGITLAPGLTWYESYQKCKSMEARLPEIKDAKENIDLSSTTVSLN